MVFIQADADCRVYKTSNAIIAVSENPSLTPDIVMCRLLDRALLALSQNEVNNQDTASHIREFSKLRVYLVTPADVQQHMTTISNVIMDDK